jgi:hypothetical protein
MGLCAQRGLEARDIPPKIIILPAELRAAGLIVPVGSMMPFPTPFDKVWTECMEYIPGVARSSRACAQLSVVQ